MRGFWILCVSLGAVEAMIVKRQDDLKALSITDLSLFTDEFRRSLAGVVMDAYEVAIDDLEELEEDFEVCVEDIEDEQDDCEKCVKDKCKPGILGSTVKFVQDIGNVFNGDAFKDMDLDLDVDNWFRNVGPNPNDRRVVSHGREVSRNTRSVDRNLLRSLVMLRGLKKKLKKAKKKAKKKASKTANKVANAVVDELLGDKDCMDKCNSCDAFLEDTPYLINEVCGPDLLLRNASLAADVEKIQWVVAAVNDSVDLMVVQTEVGGTFDMETTSMSDMYITAKFPTGDHTYKSQHIYIFYEQADTGALCGAEYWATYDAYD